MDENWYNKIVSDIERDLETDSEKGLTDEQVISKREKYGENVLSEKSKKSLIKYQNNNFEA